LFALGAFQTIPRTIDRQHRAFIEDCKRWRCRRDDGHSETSWSEDSWWHLFAEVDPKRHPERWMAIIDQYADEQSGDEKWTHRIGQFPKLYKLRRWMDDYVERFLSIERFDEPFELSQLLAPRENPHFECGVTDAPPLTRTLKIGGPLVIRELLHHGVISKRTTLAIPHAYAPIQRVKDWLPGSGQPPDRLYFDLPICIDRKPGVADGNHNPVDQVPTGIAQGDSRAAGPEAGATVPDPCQ
jgi:hypothetical protein